MLQPLFTLAATGSFCWFLASSLWSFPHSISYFNESVGGPLGGPEHLLGSNVDWGQDLRYLKRWCDQHPESLPLHLAYYGSFEPAHFGFDSDFIYQTSNVSFALTIQYPDSDLDFRNSMFALSLNLLYDYGYPARGWKVVSERLQARVTRHLRTCNLVERIGYSIGIFHWPQAVSYSEVMNLKK